MGTEEMEILDEEEEIEDLDEDNENEVQEKKVATKKAKEVVSKSFRDAIKNYLDQFAKENNLFAEKYKNQKIYCSIFVCIMESNAKNNADAIIFHTAICFGAKANSLYGR